MRICNIKHFALSISELIERRARRGAENYFALQNTDQARKKCKAFLTFAALRTLRSVYSEDTKCLNYEIQNLTRF